MKESLPSSFPQFATNCGKCFYDPAHLSESGSFCIQETNIQIAPRHATRPKHAQTMGWLVDGKIVAVQTPKHWGVKPASNAPFDQRFHLVMNLAVGGHFPGSPTDAVVFPAALEVDWVRVWAVPRSL